MADGVIYVPVAPSMRGMTGPLIKEASGAGKKGAAAMAASFEAGGKKAGQNAADGLASQRKQIERVSAEIASARQAEADAAGAVRVAEAKLADVRSAESASASKVAAAEEELARARRGQETAQSRVTTGSQQLQRIRDGEATTARTVVRAEDQLRAARNQADNAAGQVRVAETRLNELRNSGKATQAQLAAAEERVETARRRTVSATDTVRSREMLLTAAKHEAAQSSRDLARDTDTAGSRLSGLGAKAKEAISSLKGVALVGGTVGATLAAGISQSMSAEAINDKLAASLGATPAMAQQYGQTAARLYQGAWGESMEQVSESVGIVASSFRNLGQQGEVSLEKATARALDFSNAFGIDMTESVQAVSTLMATGLVKNTTQGFDLMTTAFQRVPAAMRDELPEILHEYGVNFQGLGFTGEQAFSTLVQAAGKGKFALDKTGDSLKEFSLIAASSVGDKGLEEAYARVGQNAADMANAIARGGPAAQKALQGTVAGLLDIPDAGERAATAIQLFGTPLEDLGPDQITGFLTALSQGDNAMEGFAGSADRMGQTLNDNNATRIEAFKRSLQVGLTTAVGTALGSMQQLTSFIGDNRTAFTVAASVIGAILVPALITASVSWTTTGLSATKSAALQLAASYRTVAGWVAMSAGAAANAATIATIWTVTQARAAGGWVAMQARAVGAFVATSAAATVNAAKVTVAWVASMAKTAASTAAATVAFVAQRAVLVAGAIATGVMTAAQWALNSAMLANPITWIVLLIAGLVAAIVLIATKTTWFQTAWSAAWGAIRAAIGFVWGWLSTTVFPAFQAGLQMVGNAAMWLWNNVMTPVWNGIKAGADLMWTGLSAVFGWITNGWRLLGDGVRWVVDSVIKPAWDGMKTALGAVGDFFSTVVDGIRNVWDKLKGYVATPINFVIETVWNNGLLKAWNKVASFLPGLKEMAPLSPVAFAEGGPVPFGNGAKRGKDSVHALMMPGEHVWDVMDVVRAGGQRAMYAMRSLIERGIPFTWDAARGVASLPSRSQEAIATAPLGADMGGFLRAAGIPGYATGGEVRPAWERQLENGHEAAKSRNGNPYTWGFEDCSGYMSMIADAIINGGRGVRRWATSSFPGGQPWRPGLGRGFSVGVHDDPGGPGGGHTSGTLSAVGPFSSVNVESGGSHGYVAYGGPAKGADDAQWDGVKPGRFHLGIGADGAFESAGGPSAAEQGNVIKRKVKEILDKALDPIKAGMASVIGTPPPELLGIPPTALDVTKNAAVDTVFGVIGNLGSALRSVYDTVKKITSSVTSFVTNPFGLFRDQGGYIPPGMSVVRNETGRPEAVLNWDQLEEVRKFIETTALAAGKGFLSDTADFFGFGKIFNTVADLLTPQQGATTQGANAATAGTQQGTDATTSGSGTYTAPSYGDGSTMQQKDIPLETKMPNVNDSTTPGSGDAKAQVRDAFKAYGWDSGPQWDATEWIVGKESGWNPTARNPQSGAFGLFQFLGSTKDQYLPDENPNPRIQGVAGAKYIKDRYGDPLKAKAFWEQNGWYDNGGWLQPGMTAALNLTGRPEAVLTAGQWDAIDSMLESLPGAAEFKTVADLAAANMQALSPDQLPDLVAAAPGREGPLVYVENQYTHDPEESARQTGREVRRAVRSDALVGGWG